MKTLLIILSTIMAEMAFGQSALGLTKQEVVKLHAKRGTNFTADDGSGSLLLVKDYNDGELVAYVYYMDESGYCTMNSISYPNTRLNSVIKVLNKLHVPDGNLRWKNYEQNVIYLIDRVAQADYSYFMILCKPMRK